ncbi:MAG TPA: insulinase family protein [Pyrinomonadaceae bacterium]|nr:insulinase family protein [Pyrinomonadaceae bacterium]
MNSRRPLRLFLIATVVLTSVCLAGVGTQLIRAQALSDAMPVDPKIMIGTLPNGIRYYIRANKKPEKRAELRLVIKAGSILEDDDQQGLAHLVEHMAFNGTKNFPKNETIRFMESLGMRFGADVNAYTSFDETVYTLTVPTDKPETMAKAMLILEDWAHNVSFDAAEIEKERGVVMEEWRLGQGASMRMLQKIFPVILKGSRYADRLPIGKPEIIQKANVERIKQFYREWYRPDLMAVVAVGDFDKAAMEQTIKKHFGSIPAATKPRPRQQFDVPDRAETAYAIAADKEAGGTVVQLLTLLPSRAEGTVGAYRQKTVDNLFASMLTARFSEIVQQPNAPFFNAGAGRGAFFARTKDIAFLSALVKDDGIERGLGALLTEAERVTRFGFTATELERHKQDTLRNYEQYALETENTESASRANEYVRHFLDDETLPSPADEYALHKRFLPAITLDEINKLAREWFPDRNRMVIVQAPEKAGVVIPDQAKLAAVLKSAATKDLKAYVDAASGASLLDSAPTPGSVIKTTAKEPIGITELELSNGARVILKPTTFKEDEILFRATSPGGTSLAGDSDYVPASWATYVVTSGGLGKFNVVDLQKMMAGKIATADPFISELQEGLSGSSSKKDLELLFQLIHLRFTQPRADETAFNVQATHLKTLLANQSAVPEFNFAKELQAARFQNHPRRLVPTSETINQWNLEKSMAFYRDRFADASDFTFVFVGSFDLPTIKPLIEKYLASLPSIRRKETWKDVGARTPTDVVVKRIEKGVEPKSQTAIVFSGPFEYNATNRATIRAMTEILQRRLLETLREELGGTYSVSAAPSYEKFPNPGYSITINFGSAPDRTEALVKRVFDEIESFKTNGPTEQQLKDQKETLLREFETNIKLNSYLLNNISSRYNVGEDVAGLWAVPDYYGKIDKATIQQAARTYLNPKRYVEVKLFPEKKTN